MRTTIDIDEALITDAQRLSGQATKKATIEEALRLLVRLSRQKEIEGAFGRYPWRGDLDRSRTWRGVPR